jgi:hypothetical protein
VFRDDCGLGPAEVVDTGTRLLEGDLRSGGAHPELVEDEGVCLGWLSLRLCWDDAVLCE